MCVELIKQKCDTPSVYRELIETKGGGFHHWGITAADFDREVENYKKQGYTMAFDAALDNGTRFAYFDTVDDLGGMIEFFEPTEIFLGTFAMLEDSARNWDGSDPIRRIS